ncbi:tRNA-modifying protein YgfZ, partial [Bordetella bronchiseptica]
GALPAAPWQRAELPTGTWIGAPSADAQPRWWWIATEAQLERAGALAAHLGRASESAWQAADLAAGLPWIGAATQDVFIPQTVNLDLIGGVSFTKGCYPGQEVVARSHYRGTVKRRMAHGVIAEAPADLPAPLAGQDIYDSARPDEPCGRVVDAARSDGQLALLFETTLASLPDGDLRLLSAQGPRIALAPLPYELAGNAAG